MTNKEHIKQWVDALRSGEYTQGESYLRISDRYCCLGVACNLAVEAKVVEPPTPIFYADADTHCIYYYTYGKEHTRSYLPAEVVDWFGIENNDPIIFTYHEQSLSLTTLNDTYHLSFDQIADIIEWAYLK